MWKDFFYFTKKEQQGIIILIAVIFGIFLGKYFFSNQDIASSESADSELMTNQPHVKNVDNFITDKATITSPQLKKMQVFDPNTADSVKLIELGLKPYVAKNIIKYRNKGGRFSKSSDLRRIYGLDPRQVEELEPFIKIEYPENDTRQKNLYSKNNKRSAISKATNDSIRSIPSYSKFEKQEKYDLGVKVDINLTDTNELKKIPGIGQAYANRIIKYRQMLGGFYSVEQIREVYGVDEIFFEKISQWMKVEDLSSLKMTSVNQSSLDKLKSHPYINFYQAKAIIELRKKNGKLSHISQLSLLEEFSENDLDRLKYYFEF